jgi:hypothetical protein
VIWINLAGNFRQTFLYKWFVHTNRNLMYHFIFTNALRQTYLYKWFFFTIIRNLIYHSILSNDRRQAYLYKWFEHTWQELNLSFHCENAMLLGILTFTSDLTTWEKRNVSLHSDLNPYAKIHAEVIRTHYGRNLKYHSIMTNVVRH